MVYFKCVRKSCIFNLYTSIIFIFNTSSHGQKLCFFIGLLIFKFIWRKIYSKCCARKEKKTLVLAFNSTFRYIDVLFINSSLLHSYVNSIYPSVLKLKKDMTCDDNEKYSKSNVQRKSTKQEQSKQRPLKKRGRISCHWEVSILCCPVHVKPAVCS